MPTESDSDRIAIIGIGCRLPGGASDHRTFWQNLLDEKDCITPTPSDRYDVATLGSRDPAKPGLLVGGRGGYIDGFDEFDPAFFGISPREAEHMDPQQRKLLEVAWEALEDGGQRPADLAGRDVGVFVGAFTLDYKILQFADLAFDTLAAHTATGTMMTMVSNRISHCFDFRGPSVSVDTACSSSLVAVHLAVQSLRSGESSLALAGGVLLHMAPQYTIAETKGGFLSASGRSRAFDAAADGYVRAEGVGVVALKRLADAVRDRDPIHAVIRATGVNQDGRTGGITVPSEQAQAALIARVCAEAGVAPGDLQYVEAHGTSTPVGDPVEARALARVLGVGRAPGAECHVGSVKTNIGHTEAAAGVAGLIKTALALKHRRIPAHLNLTRLNPRIDAEALPFRIPTRAVDWPRHEGPALAGVNAFGFGGTNAHVVLQEPPPHIPEQRGPQPSHTVLPLSARDPGALPVLAEGLLREVASGVPLADLGHTLANRRQHLEHRLAVVYDSRESLQASLAAVSRGEPDPRVHAGQARQAGRRLVWVFTGMGPQWWGMGRELLAHSPVYREAVERCDREIRALAGWSLVAELAADEAASRMAETWLAQPANFALQVGLAALWRSHGVRPDAIVGHSTGEVAAFHEAGVYSLRDAVRIVVHRSRLQQTLAGTGTMLAVGLPEDEAERRIRPYGGRVSVAAVNSPAALTLAGDRDALAELETVLRAEQVFAKLLTVEVPYHSAQMEPIRAELVDSLDGITPKTAQTPLYLTAREGTARGPELDAAYWWDNVRQRVRFRAAVERLAGDGHDVFLEIGPHPVLGHAIRECVAGRAEEAVTLPSIRRGEAERERFALSLGGLHTLGVDIDWGTLQPGGRVVPLPRYPWRTERYWTEPEPVRQVRLGRLDHPLLGRRLAGGDPAWEVRLDPERLPYLADHRIQGNVVFPAAGYLEMAMQAARAITGGGDAELAEIDLRRALFLSEADPRPVRFSFSSSTAAFTVASGDADDPVVHAAGVIRSAGPRRPEAPLDLGGVRARSTARLPGADCYAMLADRGYEYGPAFQAIEEVWIGADEALARIRPPAVLGADAGGHHIHPVLLDACFQALLVPDAAAGDGSAGDRAGRVAGVRLPVAIDEVRLAPVGARWLWVHARVSVRGEDHLVGDITVHGDDGGPLGRIDGFRAADVEKASAGAGLTAIDGWLAELVWTELPPTPRAREQDGEQDGEKGREHDRRTVESVLVFTDDEGFGDAFSALVVARGGRCHTVRPGEEYRRDGNQSVVRPDHAEDFDRLLAELDTDHDTVVHLWNLDLPPLGTTPSRATPRETLDNCFDVGAYSLIPLARAMASRLPGSRLHIATRGTQAVVPGDPAEPLGAPAWGVGRVLWQQEFVGQRGMLIDLDPGSGADPDARMAEAEAFLGELRNSDEEEVALRGDRRYTSRLRRPAGLTRPLPPRLRADGAYLVAGAFGALGRVLCRALVRRGARRLILMGRGALPERAQWHRTDPGSPLGGRIAFVRELEALGAQAIPAAVDITDEAGLTDWLDGWRRDALPPIRGVFHLAGQVHDRLLADMDRELFTRVLEPKAVGALLLHRVLAQEPLDHFVLFASIASVLTTAGQTNYAAGNAFLDALAHHRRAMGLPALSVDWGPWATGMISDLGLVEHYRTSRGMSSLPPSAGTAVLERVLGQQAAQLLVATVVDWPVFLAWYDTPPRLLAELAEAPSPRGEDSGFADAFRAAAPEQRPAMVAERFTAAVVTVLRVKADLLDPSVGLPSLGLDSLLAMELRARLHTELGATLPVVALLSGTGVGELADRLHTAVADAAREADPDSDSGADLRPGWAVPELWTDERRHPLTHNQKALWFLKQLNPDAFAYNIGGAVEVRTDLDPEVMFEAFRVLLGRHPCLRANFALQDGRAMQVVSDEIRPDTELFDVEGMAWDEIHALIVREYRRPYDLERDPLVRFRLFRRGPDRWVIMKAVHHIVSDAISTFVFIEELLALHDGLRRGTAVELPPVPTRYLDFLNWQTRFLASREARRMLEYWRGHLPEEIPTLTLPTDKPRPPVQTHNGASVFFLADRELSARVHALAQKHDVTVFMVLISAYYLLLHRYSGQDDVIVGSPVTGRTREEFSSTYGYFVNPLPLHVSLAGEPSVAELLERVRATVLGGLDNQEYPFVLLVEQLGLQHDPSRSAVFQAMFILLTHKVATEQYGYRLEYIELPEEEGQFDLTLSAYEEQADGCFHCVFKYNTDLFEPETVRRMAEHYLNLLDALTRAPSAAPAVRLAMLGDRERERILTQWSGAGRRAEHGRPVPELVAEAASRRPGAVAVVAPSASGEGRRLGYAELVGRARLVAGRLRDLGVRSGDVVALCMDKSPELVIALLGVLEAGAAYLPLDPGYPADRLAYMIQNAGAVLLVADGEREELAGFGPRVLTLRDLKRDLDRDLGRDPEREAGHEAERASSNAAAALDTPAALDAPAYVIYTSGSGGRPKAVRVSHRNLAAVYAGWREEYRLDRDVRVHLQMANTAFDVFTGDLVRALCSGGTLVLADRELLFDPARLYRTMRAERVDCGEFVPAVARALMRYCEREGLSLDFLRLLIVGSDTWRVGEHRRLRALCGPGTRLVNSYGLTEATVDSSFFEGSVDGMEPGRMVPVGRPFPNSSLYILDPYGEPLPPGVAGELWVGGAGVAAGYLGDPEQTEHRFVTLAPRGEPERLCRTGDLAHWDARARVHLLGRADGQVKVRGHRVETGEIESALTGQDGVSQAFVTARRTDDGEAVLCAYCVPVSGAVLDPRTLRRGLAETLPTFMIPSYFTVLPGLPLTPSGKVDAAALPAPGAGPGAPGFPGFSDAAEEPPTTLYEVRMAELWKLLLGADGVGLGHDFFEVGGSSVKLIELVHQLRAEFAADVPVSLLFKATTLRAMARTVEDVVAGRVSGALPYLRFNLAGGPAVFCFPPAGGHGLVYRQLAGHLAGYELVAFNYLPGDSKVADYADLLESVQATGPCRLLGYSLGGNLAFEVAKELERRGRHVSHLMIVDSPRIPAPYELGEEHLAAFEGELAEHLQRHTGSRGLADATRHQARDYLEFCSRTPNTGSVAGPITVIANQGNAAGYADGQAGSWHASTADGATVLCGAGTHAEMLDAEQARHNAVTLREVLEAGAR